jgi:cellulose synthase/poly-beta-1,6-N-acetylglucosamine synthase-like glycosyltransferase
MTDLEIPFESERKGHYRVFEILPGFLSYFLISLPIILSLISVTLAAFFILFYLITFFVRSLGYSTRSISGYITMRQHMKLDWNGLAEDIDNKKVSSRPINRPKWHYNNLKLLNTRVYDLKPKEIVHAVIIATVNESREVLEPTIQAVLNSDFDPKRLILVMAYEARAGKQTEVRVKELLDLYGDKFKHAMMVKHPANIKNEVIGKGGNITYAGRALKRYVDQEKLDPTKVLVTTLDSDNRVDKLYFACLSYLYCVVPNAVQASYQPLAMYTNNIWDAPTLMRVIATGNNLFYIVNTKRPHMSRNFSAHAQPLRALIDTDFWSTRTVVEDGHQFWRSYFRYEGDYRVYPFSIPVYQDAVLAEGYMKTMKAQFIQLRRWTYGASDVAYIADKGFWHKNSIPKADVLAKMLRTLESHVTWATGTIIVYFAALIPPLIRPQNLAANQLPLIVQTVQRIGIAGLLLTIYICLVTLPPRPARHKRHRSVLMFLQWFLLPVSSLVFGSMAAFNSQTRLIFKRYLSRFDVTEKTIITSSGKKISTKADPSKV